MRIAVLTDSLADTDGVGRYTLRLMTAIQRLRPGTGVEIAIARKHPGLSAEVPVDWPVKVVLPPDYFFYMSRVRFHAYLTWSVLRVLPMVRRADIVHATKDFPHCYIGLLAAELAGKPCVMTAHGTYSVMPLTDPRHARRARRAFPRFGKILCVSHYTRRRIEERISLSNLEVVKNAVDARHYAPRAVDLDTATLWRGKLFTLGIGAVKERKGHHVAIDGILRLTRAFPDLVHYVIGVYQESDPYFQSIRRSIAEAGCQTRVVFLGNVGEAVKIDLLRNAFAFVHAPVSAADGGFEGFGIVYLEAAAAGAPSIGSLGSGAEDAVVNGETGFLVNADGESVAEALRKLLTDRALRDRMSTTCVEYAKTQSWDRNAARVLDIYGALLERGRSR